MFGGRFWRQLAGLAGEMVLEQAIGGQMVPQMVLLGGGGVAPAGQNPSEPGPPTRVLLDYLQYIRIGCALYTP